MIDKNLLISIVNLINYNSSAEAHSFQEEAPTEIDVDSMSYDDIIAYSKEHKMSHIYTDIAVICKALNL